MQELGLVESVRCRDAMGCGKVGDSGLLVNPMWPFRSFFGRDSRDSHLFQGRLPEKSVLQDCDGIGWQLLPFWTSSSLFCTFFCHVDSVMLKQGDRWVDHDDASESQEIVSFGLCWFPGHLLATAAASRVWE